MELLLIYVLGRVSKDQKNRELRAAYVELGQTQKRLEIALSAAQKAAAVDELTGMMNARSVIAHAGDSFNTLSKKADEYLYQAKESHDGGFSHPDE